MKLSSILKSRKFDNGTKMIAVAPHHLIYTYLIYSYKALDIVKLVWAIVLSVPKAMREPENEIRQYVPTPLLFMAYHREQVGIIF